MKTDAIHSIVHFVTGIAVIYFPAHAFYGATLWQMSGIYLVHTLITVAIGVIAMVSVGLNEKLSEAVIRFHQWPASKIVVQVLGALFTFAIFNAIMHAFLPQSVSIHNIIVYLPSLLSTWLLAWVFKSIKSSPMLA